MLDFNEIKKVIMNDPMNVSYTQNGIEPLYVANKQAKILIIGQAPGKKAQDTNIAFNDPSGDRLREWMGIDRDIFYDSSKIAILPMDFYFPGKGKSGDLPPRKGFAEKFHHMLLELMPHIGVTLLIGSYAQHFYLSTKDNSTQLVQNFRDYLPKYFPLVHPSPRNNIWLAKNPWFETEVVVELKKIIEQLLNT